MAIHITGHTPFFVGTVTILSCMMFCEVAAFADHDHTVPGQMVPSLTSEAPNRLPFHMLCMTLLVAYCDTT